MNSVYSDKMTRLGETLVEILAASDAFNEKVGKEVDEILAERIESEVDRVVEDAVDSAVDKAVESHIEDALADYESPLESRVEDLERSFENFEDPNCENMRLHDRIDHLVGKIDELTDRIWNLENPPKSKAKVWWMKSWWIFPI